MARLAAHRDAYQHVLYAYPAAGHGAGSLVPYEPVADTATPGANLSGRSPDANPDADALLWPRLLEFLASVTKGPTALARGRIRPDAGGQRPPERVRRDGHDDVARVADDD